MDTEQKRAFIINVLFAAIIAAAVYLILRFTLSFLLPFVIGTVLSFLLQRPAAAISEKVKIDKRFCTVALVTAVFVLITVAASAAIWLVVLTAGKLAQRLPSVVYCIQNMYKSLSVIFENALNRLPLEIKDSINGFLIAFLDRFAAKVSEWLSVAAADAAKGFPTFIFSSFVTVIASFYISKDYRKIIKFFQNLISEKSWERVVTIKNIITGSVLKFALGYLILMMLTFAELWIGFSVIGIKYSVLAAAVIAVIDILPVLGTGTALIPWGIIELTGGDPSSGIKLLALYVVITVIRNIAEPRIVGGRLGINPLFTLITIFVGLRISGFAGMVILPLASIVVIKYYKKQLDDERNIAAKG